MAAFKQTVREGLSEKSPLWTQRLPLTPQQFAAFCARWGISELALFGSVLRDDFTPGSDVDIMVRLDPNQAHGPFDWVDMRDELETLLGRKVDLVSSRALRNPFRRASILATREVLYAA